MADVTGARNARKPRPLGVVKEKTLYYDTTPRYADSFQRRGGGLHREKSVHRDMKENIQQATLINIVAAVNETYNSDGSPKRSSSETGSASESLNNTMAVISNLMTPRDRTISIPTTQVVFQLPDTVVQRKPVYYKHSEDEEVRRDQTHTISNTGCYNMKVKTKQEEWRKTPTPEKVVKVIPAKSPSLPSSVDTPAWEKDSNRLASSRSWSPVRRLGAVSRRPDSRRVREISKCDAIDIMESTETLKLSQMDFSGTQSLVPSGTDTGETGSQGAPFAFYRTKSLPAMFPAKTLRLIRSVQSNRSSSEKLKPRPASRGFGRTVTDSLTVVQGKPVSLPGRLTLDGTSISNGQDHSDEDKTQPGRLPSRQRQKHYRPMLSLSKLIAATEVTVQDQFGPRSAGNKPKQQESRTQLHYQKTLILSHPKDREQKPTNSSNKTTSSSSSPRWSSQQRPSSETNLSDVSAVIESRNSEKGKKSCIASKPQLSEENTSKKETKRVQFAGNLEETDFSVKEDTELANGIKKFPSSTNTIKSDKDMKTLADSNASVNTVSQTPQSNTMQQQLDRLKQKVIRADIQTELKSQSYNFAANTPSIQISGIHRVESDLTNMSQTSDWEDRDSFPDVFDEADDKTDVEGKTETNGTPQNGAHVDESHWTHSNDHNNGHAFSDRNCGEDDDEENSGGNSDTRDSPEHSSPSQDEAHYRVLKAVERDSYSGFEHKKIRKASSSTSSRTTSDHSKAHFVKIKVGDVA